MVFVMQMMQYAFYPTNMSSQNVGQILKGSIATLALNIDNWQYPGKLLLEHKHLLLFSIRFISAFLFFHSAHVLWFLFSACQHTIIHN